MTVLDDQASGRRVTALGHSALAEPQTRADSRRTSELELPALRARRQTQTARVAILGCGTVGSEVARQLISLRDHIGGRCGIHVELARILVRDTSLARDVDRGLLTTDLNEILRSNPNVVIELLGGIEPAFYHVSEVLRRGIPIVTANKALIAHRGEELRTIAAQSRTNIHCEACVGGAVPILAALRQLQNDRIRYVGGIVNGSCNFILTRMIEAKLSFEDALDEAAEAGLVEPDPAADISGRDAAEKLSIIAAAAGLNSIAPHQVQTSGIESITLKDIDVAKSYGFFIKLIAELHADDHRTIARVGPMLVPRRHPFGRTLGAENTIQIESELGGRLLLQGQGAGPRCAASAILGDLHRAVVGEVGTIMPSQASRIDPRCNLIAPPACRWFVRLSGATSQRKLDHIFTALASNLVHVHQIECGRDSMEIIAFADSVQCITGACDAVCSSPADRFVAPILD